MRTLAILTTNRADFSLLNPLIQRLMEKEDLEVRVLVTGAHLSKEYGYTVKEIEEAGLPIDVKIEILENSDTPAAVSETMANALNGFASYFERRKPDALLVLGDRTEVLAVALAAANARIPVFHLSGGETTEGAMDEYVRHCLTKIARYHFTATEEFRRRVIQLGEHPSRVFSVGALSVENAVYSQRSTKEELESFLHHEITKPLAVCTFHPVTLEEGTAKVQIKEILKAIESFPNMLFLWTKANSDVGGRTINRILEAYAETHDNTVLVDSLGSARYLCALSMAEFVLGNSSSGLSEVPSFGIPTINIGDRQKGRPRAPGVIDCPPECDAVIAAIQKASSAEFRKLAAERINPYGDGNTSSKIADKVDELMNGDLNIRKSFYDMEGSEVR